MGTKRRVYMAAEREAAVADVPAMGVMAAAKRHGTTQSCLSRWASAAGVRRASGDAVGAQAEGDGAASTSGATEVAASAPEPTRPQSTTEEAAETAATPPKPSVADKRVLRGARVAKLYTPSQKAEVVEHAAAHGVTSAAVDRAVEGVPLIIRVFAPGLEQQRPSAIRRPAVEPSGGGGEHRLPRAELLGEIAPGHARAPPPEHCFAELAVVPPASPRTPVQEQRLLDPRPLLIAKLAANHASDGARRRSDGKSVQ
jgi:transposase-like protein